MEIQVAAVDTENLNNKTKHELVERAIKHGFSHASLLDVSTLTVRSEVRDMCRVDKCQMYDKNWMCPPACNDLSYNVRRAAEYKSGLIVQTRGILEDDFDYYSMMAANDRQQKLFASFRDELKDEYPKLTALGNGSCKICPTCAYPDSPCRFPERAVSSMEAL